jgi:hypothetical protein
MTIRTDPERDPIAQHGRPALIFRPDGSEVLLDLTWCVCAVARDSIGAHYPMGISPALLRFLASAAMDETEPHDALIAHCRREAGL